MIRNILFFFIGAVLSSIIIYIIQRKRNRKRIDELSKMIERLNKNEYSINMKQDEFSVLEDDIYKLFLEIVQQREMLDSLYKTQSENIENIAHQIKTPLTAMSFQLENIDVSSGEKIPLEKQIYRLNSLTDILLKLSSLDSNLKKMKREKIILQEILEYAIDILSGEIKDFGTKIVMENLDNEIDGDFYWICEAVINILKNALLISSNKSIFISSSSNPIYTELIIEDEGGGIKIKNKKDIFKRFYKSPDSKGFGLGLAMAKSIIEANNGEIDVSNGEKGAVFRIKFY